LLLGLGNASIFNFVFKLNYPLPSAVCWTFDFIVAVKANGHEVVGLIRTALRPWLEMVIRQTQAGPATKTHTILRLVAPRFPGI